MKKAFLICLLSIILMAFTGCTDDVPPERNWRDDFTVSCRHIEESQFDDKFDALEAILNGTYIDEQDEYTVTNKTNYVFERVYLVFYADFAGYEPYEFKESIGTLKQGETKVKSITKVTMELGAKVAYFPDNVVFDFDRCTLLRIEYEIAE